MIVPTNLEAIDALIRDRVQENIHLDYKAGAALGDKKADEISKDVSAFANSDGGVIVYGVSEDKETHVPLAIEAVTDKTLTKEWLEQVINSRMTPIIDGVRIHPIEVTPGTTLFVVEIPKSRRGPHQASDKKYYKRYNFRSAPMEDYEINDVRNRRHTVSPLISFEVFDWRRFVAAFDVANVGAFIAEDISFTPPLQWPQGLPYPTALNNGIRSLAPKQQLRFLYHSYPDILGATSTVPKAFEVTIKYFHTGEKTTLSDVWTIDFSVMDNSLVVRSEMEEQAKEAVEGLKSLTEQVKALNGKVESLFPLVGSTGLDLSIPTIRSIGRVLRDGLTPEKLHPFGQEVKVFREVLGVAPEMAVQIANAISYHSDPDRLAHIPGMTPELLAQIKLAFILEEAEKAADEQKD
jgi:hypothetical protein